MRTSALLAGIRIGLLVVWAANPKPLTLQHITLSQYEDGAAVPGDYTFEPGETIYFSFQVSGYKSIGDETPSVGLDYTIDVQDPAGIAVVPAVAASTDVKLDPEDKNWMPKIRHTIPIPAGAVSGDYRILITLKDRVAFNQVEGKAIFRVRGLSTPTADALMIRDFHFFRGEEDKKPLDSPHYRAGDPLWARFEIAGYKFSGNNRFEVGYGLAVLRPNGEQMFRQDDAAVEKDESFYPRRVVPAGLSLSLNKDLKPGEYTLIVMVKDKVGGQTAEARHVFSVEQ